MLGTAPVAQNKAADIGGAAGHGNLRTSAPNQQAPSLLPSTALAPFSSPTSLCRHAGRPSSLLSTGFSYPTSPPPRHLDRPPAPTRLSFSSPLSPFPHPLPPNAEPGVHTSSSSSSRCRSSTCRLNSAGSLSQNSAAWPLSGDAL